MSYDGFYTRTIVNQLKTILIGGRISKIYQPFEQEIHLVIRSQRKNHRLLASIHPNYYRLHLTDEKTANPQQAPMFSMILRKHLESSIVLDIQQVDNDRIVEFTLSGRNDLGDLRNYKLIFELMGKHSNIILVDNESQTIIDCIKHVSPHLNSYRGLQPGSAYIRPPRQIQQKNIFSFTDNELNHFIEDHKELLENGKANQVIQGMGKDLAKELAYQISKPANTVEASLKHLILTCRQPQPTLIHTQDGLYFHMMNLDHLLGEREVYPDPSSLVERYYQEKVHADRVKQLTGNLLQRLDQIIKRNREKIVKLEDDKAIAQASDTYRIYGELLSAYAYQITKGQKEACLPNYYDNDQEIIIPLKVNKSPIENSQMYFKKYAKYRDSLKFIDGQISKAQEEIDYLEGILVQLYQADLEDIETIKEELQNQGYLSNKKSSTKQRAKSNSQPRQFLASDGTKILVGRNNQQNDDLSLKKSNKEFWWLHTKDIPGAHVIINATAPSDQTFTEAAIIAAFYSKSQNSANVPVDTVQVKKLHKPNGAKPGFVIYEGQKTLYVTPDAQMIEQLSLHD